MDFTLSALSLQSTTDQVDSLILAWTLLLYRNGTTITTPDFTWAFGDPVDFHTSAVPPAATLASYPISGDSLCILKPLEDIRTLRQNGISPDSKDYRLILATGDAATQHSPEVCPLFFSFFFFLLFVDTSLIPQS
jgi:hypothetical protein